MNATTARRPEPGRVARLIVTRPATEAAQWVQVLHAHGWPAHALPLIDIGEPTSEQARAALAEQQAKPQPATEPVPDSVTQDLLALASPMQQPQLIQPRFNVAAANVEAADFFTSLVADTDYSVAIHPAVTGQITLDLKQVTLNEAFAVVEQLYGYHIQQVGSIYKVMPGGLRTETIPVNYLLMQRSGNSSISVTAGGISSSQGGNNSGNIIGNNPNLKDLDNGDLRYEIDFRSIYAALLQSKMDFDYKKIGITHTPIKGLF